jgi:hypothetical protein
VVHYSKLKILNTCDHYLKNQILLLMSYDFEHYFIEDSEWTFDVASQNQPQIDLFIEGVLVEKLEAQCHRTIKKNKM